MTHLQRAEAALNKAANGGHPEHKIGDALVGIGYALLHWLSTQEEGRDHGDTD
jgi:hypothetical protein